MCNIPGQYIKTGQQIKDEKQQEISTHSTNIIKNKQEGGCTQTAQPPLIVKSALQLTKEKPIIMASAKMTSEIEMILITRFACSSSFLVCVTFFLFLLIIVSFKVQR